jgi:GxxExxY protein
MQHEELTKIIIGCAYTVHNTLGAGFLEKVYENALCLELKKQGLDAIQQLPIKVYYNNQIVGDYYADIMVNNIIILELKAVDILHSMHEIQLVNYLNATQIDVGLLINFGRSVEIKRKFRFYTKTKI